MRASIEVISARPWTNDLADAAWLPVCSWDLPVIPIDCGAAQPDWDSGSLYANTKSFFFRSGVEPLRAKTTEW